MLQEHNNEDNSNCDSDQTCQLGEGQGDTEQFLSLQSVSYSSAQSAVVSQLLLE